jgi:uncharacterized protein
MQIRDPIHGFIEYDETEEKLINSDVFQRLRGIKQLAMASLVYPSANHTRFEHCIGTMHLAGIIAKKFFPANKYRSKRRIIKLAGLLHDIGHGPFSHVSDQILENYVDENTLKEFGLQKGECHELMSILLVKSNKEIREILTASERKNIINIIANSDNKFIEKDLVSGALDADKLDYLIRDSHFAGVSYGIFDIDKIIESLREIEVSSSRKTVGIYYEGVYALEQMLLAKYHMTEQVYKHRIRRITDAMIVRGIEFAIEEGIDEIKKLFEFQNKTSFLNNYIRYDDKLLMDTIRTKSNSYAKEYFDRLKERRLFKELFDFEIEENIFPDGIELKKVKELSPQQVRNIEYKTADIFKIDPVFVIVDKQTSKNPTFRSPERDIDSRDIIVMKKDGNRAGFQGVSKIFNNPSVASKKEMLYIYIPLDDVKNKQEKKNEYESKKQETINIIKEEVKNAR